MVDHFIYFAKYTSIGKAIKYLKSITRCGNMNARAKLWKDYLEMCTQLKYDLKNDFVLKPKDLKARSMRWYSERYEMQRKKRTRKIKKLNKCMVK